MDQSDTVIIVWEHERELTNNRRDDTSSTMIPEIVLATFLATLHARAIRASQRVKRATLTTIYRSVAIVIDKGQPSWSQRRTESSGQSLSTMDPDMGLQVENKD